MNDQQVTSMETDENITNDIMEISEIEKLSKKMLRKETNNCDLKLEFLQSLYNLRLTNMLCDAVIKLEDGGVFCIHRVVLSTCSPFFR